MNPIMAGLRNDHKNITKVMSVLGKELEKFSNDDHPDLYLMLDIIDYVEKYPDLIHHPKEDVIFEVFTTKMGETQAAIADLLDQHQKLPKVTHELRDTIEGIVDDAIVIPRDELCAKIQAYIDIQQKHLQTEETSVFPMIEAAFDSEDWDKAAAQMPSDTDPLFGDHLNERYEHLLQFLLDK